MMKERSRKVLISIVKNYVESAEPIGSRFLAKKSGISLSAATIRNIMADLTELGFIEQPHTSAGRVPTDKGYRFYVDQMLNHSKLEKKTSEKIKSCYESPLLHFDDILQITTQLLSDLTHLTAVVVSPRPLEAKLKKIEYLLLSEKQCLIVLVTQGGLVFNKIVNTREKLSQEFLDSLSDCLNQLFRHDRLVEIKSRLVEALGEEKGIYKELLAQAIRLGKKAFELSSPGELYLFGQAKMLQFPEFSNPHSLKTVYQLFEEKDELARIFCPTQSQGVRISIGGEINCEELSQCSVITANYGEIGDQHGSLGVIGPTRMDYSGVASIIDYTAKKLTQLVSRFNY